MLQLIVWLVFLVFFGAIVFGAVMIAKALSSSSSSSSSSQVNPKALQPERVELKRKINEAALQLTPWGDRTAKNISCAIKYKYKKGFTFSVNGTVYSDDQHPILKYARREKGFNLAGHFYAATSSFSVYCIQNSNTYNYWFNEEYVGKILPSGKIFNAQKEEIGFAKHPVKASINVGMVKWRFGDTFYSLTIRDKHVADIKVSPDYSDSFSSDKIFSLVFNENNSGGNIISERTSPNDEEEVWLKLLAVTESVYHSFMMP